MITAPMLQVVQQSGEAVLVLADDLDEADFRRSRLTRQELLRQLGLMAGVLGALPPAARQALPEIDWDGWQALRRDIEQHAPTLDDSAWFGVRSLVPATLSWLRVYRQSSPALFDFGA